MEEMRWVIVVVLLALAGPASAQQPAQWVRLSLNDGRFVDGYITGGDGANHFVQTSYGYFSILRTNVVAITPMGAPAPAPAAYAPNPGYAPMPSPYARPEGKKSDFGRGAGLVYFGVFYGITVLAASAKVDNDNSAKAGYIPVVGPMLWAFSDDEDDVGEDGWDWLAVGGTLMQGMGAWLFITGGESKSSKRVSITPVTSRHYSGLAAFGRF
jgi:hypothetical protein